jgi:hypothetical protein
MDGGQCLAKSNALWDGSAGGTSNRVAYVQRRRKPCENLWKQWLVFRLAKIERTRLSG